MVHNLNVPWYIEIYHVTFQMYHGIFEMYHRTFEMYPDTLQCTTFSYGVPYLFFGQTPKYTEIMRNGWIFTLIMLWSEN